MAIQSMFQTGMKASEGAVEGVVKGGLIGTVAGLGIASLSLVGISFESISFSSLGSILGAEAGALAGAFGGFYAFSASWLSPLASIAAIGGLFAGAISGAACGKIALGLFGSSLYKLSVGLIGSTGASLGVVVATIALGIIAAAAICAAKKAYEHVFYVTEDARQAKGASCGAAVGSIAGIGAACKFISISKIAGTPLFGAMAIALSIFGLMSGAMLGAPLGQRISQLF